MGIFFEGISMNPKMKKFKLLFVWKIDPHLSKFVYQELVYNKNIINIIEGKRNVSWKSNQKNISFGG